MAKQPKDWVDKLVDRLFLDLNNRSGFDSECEQRALYANGCTLRVIRKHPTNVVKMNARRASPGARP